MPVVAAPTTELMPRMEMPASPDGSALDNVRPGVTWLMSPMSLMLSLSSAGAPSAATLMGTFVMTCSRRCAVTVTTSTWLAASEPSAGLAASGAACDQADDTHRAPAATVNREEVRDAVLTRNPLWREREASGRAVAARRRGGWPGPEGIELARFGSRWVEHKLNKQSTSSQRSLFSDQDFPESMISFAAPFKACLSGRFA
jgi:hypothetical protein